MLYVITGHDVPESFDLRMQHRPAHLARLQALADSGRLLLAGPLSTSDASDLRQSGVVGSVIIAEFEDLLAARTWAESDPFLLHGIYREVTVNRFRKVLP